MLACKDVSVKNHIEDSTMTKKTDLGIFENEINIGDPNKKGSVSYNPEEQE